ncbi:MAG: sigma-E processing peptidase SpoIIGA [Bacillota bacterium]|nr:sigma-E processing peptidase SpoIIGA [Bacillota bacterium]
MVLYLDLLFVLNFFMNLTILSTAGLLLGLKISISRLCLAAILGAGYVLLATTTEIEWMFTFLPTIIISIVLSLISVGNLKRNIVIKYLLCMYFVAFALGGVILSISNMFIDASVNTVLGNLPQINSFSLFLGVIVIILIIKPLKNWLMGLLTTRNFLLTVIINLDGRESKVTGLIDTGNHLTDPITGNPVIVVESTALRELLPEKFADIMGENENLDLNKVADLFGTDLWGKRLRVIPFSSVGKEFGIMIGFKPDLVVLESEGDCLNKTNVIIGLCEKALCPDNSYNALVNPRLVQ